MYKESALVRRNNELFYFRHAPPHLDRAQPEDAYSGNRPAPPYTGAQGWKCSIYYYWWRFVREVPGLREQISTVDSIPLGSIAHDFSHVFDCNFREWWGIQGRKLFSEPRETGVKIETPPFPADGFGDRAIFSIPLNGDLEQAMSELRHLLKPEMAQFKAEQGPSRARYPVFANPPLSSLHTIFTVWRARKERPDLTVFDLADFIDGKLGQVQNDAHTKSVKSATIGRYLGKAKVIIDYAGRGLFPVIKPSAKAEQMAERLASERRSRQIREIAQRQRDVH